MSNNKLPAIKELYESKELMQKQDALTVLLNQPPSKTWIKKHPFIRNYNYIPIARVEYLLKTIFKKYRIEVLREGTSFNGVYVVVRVHYMDPITGEMEFHDGIGAIELQTKKGTSPSDLANINNGALGMALPIAKSRALKNACSHFGKLFGSDLNREDDIAYNLDVTLIEMTPEHPNWSGAVKGLKQGYSMDDIAGKYEISEENKELLLKLSKDEV